LTSSTQQPPRLQIQNEQDHCRRSLLGFRLHDHGWQPLDDGWFRNDEPLHDGYGRLRYDEPLHDGYGRFRHDGYGRFRYDGYDEPLHDGHGRFRYDGRLRYDGRSWYDGWTWYDDRIQEISYKTI
ncbi:hypothetical protein LOTGIDRAFT_232566, partial [Lottia gigantea]